MRSTQTSLVKKIASFLTATSIMCSVCGSNFSAFAEYFDDASRYKASIVDDTENGTVEFVVNERYEDVYKEVPIENSEIGITVNENGELVQEVISDSDLTEEITELVTEAPTEEVSTEASTEAIEVTEETTATETTEAITEEVTEVIVEETIVTEAAIEEATVENTEEITEEVIEEVVEETTENKIEYTAVVDPRAKNIFSGDTVILNAIPDEGYYVESVYVVADSGKAVAYSFNDNVISFSMPKADVTIRATFTDDLSEIEINKDVEDSYTYIKSNLNSDYVTMNKWEAINAIKVKQTVVDKSVLEEQGLDVTLDNLDSDEDYASMFDAFINFQSFFVPIYDVDTNSDYYVAFVNTMQNDACSVYEYIVAKNNLDGIEVKGNYFDKNTGILYINKNNTKALKGEDATFDNLFDIQVQLLTVFEDSSNIDHQVNLIVNDKENALDIESGSITLDQYDENVSIRLADNDIDTNATVKINGVEYGNINLNEDTSTDIIDYSADSKVLTIASKSIDTNSIEINTNENNETISAENSIDNAVVAATLNEMNNTDAHGNPFPVWSLKKGTASTTGSVDIVGKGESQQIVYYSTDNIESGYVDDSGKVTEYTNTSISNGYFAYASLSVSSIFNGIMSGNTDLTKLSLKADSASFTYTYRIYTADAAFDDFTIKNGNNSATWRLTPKSGHDNAFLVCGHIAANFDDNEDNLRNEVRLRVFDVDTKAKRVIWGMITKSNQTQVGVGLFSSSYQDISSAKLSMSKTFNNADLATDTLTDSFYKNTGVYYSLKHSDGTEVAVFTTDNDLTYWRSMYNKQLHPLVQDWTYVIKKDTNTLYLKPGKYSITETSSSKGYVAGKRSSPKTGTMNGVEYVAEGNKITFTLKANDNFGLGETNFGIEPIRRNYPVSLAFVADKIDENDPNAKPSGGLFTLYYRETSDALEKAKDKLDTSKLVVNSLPSGSRLSSSSYFTKVATFTADGTGQVIPTEICHEFSKYTDPSRNNAEITFPDIASNGVTLINLPKGYYVFVEEEAPTGYDLDLSNGYPAFYYFAFTSTPAKGTATLSSVYQYSLADLSKYKYEYGTSGYASTEVNDGNNRIDVKNIGNVGLTVQKEIPNYLLDGSTMFTKKMFDDSAATIKLTTSSDLVNCFMQMFPNHYSLKSAKYKLWVKNKLYATGTTNDTGHVIWSREQNGISAGITISLDGKYVKGIPHGTEVKLEEFERSAGTYIRKSVSYHTLPETDLVIGADGDLDNSSNENGLQLNTLKVNKRVKLDDGSIIHFNDDTLTNADKKKYFAGMSFDVYYSLDGTTFPELALQDKNGDGTDDSWKLANPNIATIGKVATINFVEKPDGTVVQEINPEFFTTSTYGGYFYKATAINSNTGLSSLDNLPLGNYLIFESSPATNTDVKYDIKYATYGDCNQGKYYVTFEGNGTTKTIKTIAMHNSTIPENTKFSLQKDFIDELSVDELKAANGAKYYIYYDPSGTLTKSDAALQFGSFDKGIYRGNKPIYLVGEFNTAYGSDNAVHGMCVNNLFNTGRKWTYSDEDKDSDNYANLQSLINNATVTLDALHQTTDGSNVIYTAFNTSIYDGKVNASNADALLEKSNNYPFECIAGQYLVVEAKAPYGYSLDETVHFITVNSDGTSNVESSKIISTEKSEKDPINIDINKINKQGFAKHKSLAGTQFTVQYYKNAKDLDECIDLTDEFIFEVKNIDGLDTINLSNPDFLVEYNSSTISSYLDLINNEIVFGPGYFKIFESKSTADYEDLGDGFIGYINGTQYTFSSELHISKHFNDAGELCTVYHNAYDEVNNRLLTFTSKDLNFNIQFYKNNTIGEPFILNKNYVAPEGDTVPEKTTFELIRYANTDSGISEKSWRFDVITDTEFKSEDCDEFFKTWDTQFGDITIKCSDEGRPLVEGLKYKLVEIGIDSNGNEFYKQATDVFTYTKGMDISSNFKTDASANTIDNYPEPSIKTYAWDKNTETKAAFYGDEDNPTISLVDTVKISNIARNNTYIVQGIAVDVTDPANPKFLKDANGNYVRGASAIFAYDFDNKITSVSVNVEYTFAGNKETLAGKTINFYEYLTLADSSNLMLQFYTNNPVKPEAYGYRASKSYKYTDHVNTNQIAVDLITLEENKYDMVMINNGTPAWVSQWSKSLKLDEMTPENVEKMNAVTAAIVNGKINEIPGIIYTTDKNDVIRHTDPNDNLQNIYFPNISTHEFDVYTSSHVSGLHYIPVLADLGYSNVLCVADKFTVDNLIAGEYNVEIAIMKYGATASEDSFVTSTYETFTQESNGSKTIDIGPVWALDANDIDKFYITENLYDSEFNLIATHTDREVESQQGYVAKIGTTASNAIMDSKLILGGSNATVKDTVAYRNLVEHNHEYYLYGFLVDTTTNEIVSKASTSFNNGTNTNGTADVNFKFTAEPGQTLVAYEYLYWDNSGKTTYDSLNVGDTFTNDQDNKFYRDNGDYLLARHYDKTDVGQTVYVPEVGTEVLGDKEILPKSEVTITDQVFYKNLLANETYTIYGYFVDKNKTVDESDDVLVATGRKTMTPTSTSGTATMDFTFDSTKFIDKEIVVYEYIYLGDVTTTFNPVVGQTFDKNAVPESLGGNGRMIGRHADSTDKNQTVHVTGVYVDILKTDSEGNVLPGAKFRLTDLDNNKQLGEWITGTERKSFTLAPGDYMLEELEAPNGKALNTEIRFSVVVENSDIKVYYTGTNIELKSKVGTDGVKHYELDLADPDLTRLPTAGGTGVLPIVGAGLLCIAAGAFVIKRRKSNNNEEI